MSDLTREYWKQWALSQGDRAQRLAAMEMQDVVDEVDEVVEAGGQRAIDTLVSLAGDAHPDDEALAFLGAGLLENFLLSADDAGLDALESVIERAGVKQALGYVWLGDSLPAHRRDHLQNWLTRLGVVPDVD